MKTFTLFASILILIAAAVFTTASSLFHQKEQRLAQHRSLKNGGGQWVPPHYNQTVWESCRSKQLLNPQPPVNMTYNWYDVPNFNTTWPDSICTVVFPNMSDRTKYFLKNFSSVADASAANESGNVFETHFHPCGACSNMNDLSIYMQYPDLTNPGRLCGFEGFLDFPLSVKCFQKIGFTEQCSYIWARDAQNTRKDCEAICLKAFIEHWPNNQPPNSTNLNPCLECDEVKSGPIFKLIAGRTRRDSGLQSSIKRPANEVSHLTHFYCLN